jgi:hypothetical protein
MWVGVLVLLASSVVGCSPPETPVDPNATVEPPGCASIITFGNGQTCSVKSAALTECGASKQRTCANGWLCFDAAKYAFCSCHADSDCQPRADYVNKARAVRKIAPLGAKCVENRCAGAP